jgi:type I restriction enzyme S subunit
MQFTNVLSNFSLLTSSVSGISNLRNYILTQAVSGSFSRTKPDSWKKSTLGAEVDIIRGITFPSSAKYREPSENRIVCLRTTNVQDQVDWIDLLYVPKSYVKNDNQYIKKNDILISMANSRELVGKVSLVKRDDIHCTLGGFIAAIRCSKTILPEFLMILLRTPATKEKIIDSSTQTTNIANISLGRLRPLELNLPSIEEQLNIVNKVSQLFDRCDQLESYLNEMQSLSKSTRRSFVDGVSTAQTPEELQNASKRIQKNLEIFSKDRESVDSLRALIFTLATRGSLVKQDLSDPSPRFLEVASESEIPKNWIWCELDEIAYYGGSGAVKPDLIPKDGWLLDLEDIEKGTSKLLIRVFGSDRKTTSNKASFESGDVLYGKLRPYLDKVLVADMPGFCTTEIVPIRPKKGLDPRWLRICLKRPEFVSKVTQLSYGTKMPRLGTVDAKASVHPVPPFQEQQRIIEKVDQLLEICDKLEESLILAEEISEKFSRSVIASSA